jgi:hypothetical protein
MLKDRSVGKEKKDEIISVRIPRKYKEKLREVAGERGLSHFVTTLIKSHLRTRDVGRTAYYQCDLCGKDFKVNEPYYCELANKEKFVFSEENPEELEIEVIDSVPTEILCLECAKKEGKLGPLEEHGPASKDEIAFVKESERKVEEKT